MFSALLYIFAILSVWSDWKIFKVYLKDKGALWKWLWKVQSIVCVFPFLILFVGGFVVDIRWTAWVIFSQWYIFLFLLQFASKFFLALALKIGRKWLVPVAAAMSLLVDAVFLYGVFVTRCEIDVRHVDIMSHDIPENFDGFRVALVSDLHLGTMALDNGLLERVVDSLNSLDADVVIQDGDLINIDVNELTPEVVDLLGRIRGPVYAVLGNHDQGFYFKDTVEIDPLQMLDSLRRIQCGTLGWTLLENSHLYLERGGDSIAIAGVTYPNNFAKYANSVCGKSDLCRALDGINESDFSILLSHSPLMADSLSEKGRGVDLMLSGHTHSMQMRVAGICPSFFIYRYPWGLYDIEGTALYVNGGIGTVGYPFRIGASPEITLFTLIKI